LGQGMCYFLSFFRYETDQDILLSSPHFSALEYLQRYWLSWIAGALCFGVGQLVMFSSRCRLYSRLFIAAVDLAVGLSIIWSAFQDGPMYDFNGNYFYAVIYLVYIFPLIFVDSVIPARLSHRAFYLVALGGTVALVWIAPMAAKPLFTIAVPADALNVKLLTVTHGASLVHVTIPQSRWIAGFGTVLALDRLGIAFKVDPPYAFLYGERRAPSAGIGKEIYLNLSEVPCDRGILIPDFGYGRTYLCSIQAPELFRKR